MSLIIHAPNVHFGGGRTLLLSLLSSLQKPAVVQIDERLEPLPELAEGVRVIRVAPRLMARLRAERRLRSLCSNGDILLCFGNLPPLYRSTARVFVYLQNRYLTSPSAVSELPFRARLRIRVERLWLRYFLRDAIPLVQTGSMAEEVLEHLGWNARIIPFIPKWPDMPIIPHVVRYDYLYVASGEPHKNHRCLLEAWVILARYGFRPSLYLTLDPLRDGALCAFAERLAEEHELQITIAPWPSEQIFSLYAQSKALIYPSLFESFGLPLLEAAHAKLPIIAAERDYVRDVVAPVISFDPESSLSIARAVLRHEGRECDQVPPEAASSFLGWLAECD